MRKLITLFFIFLSVCVYAESYEATGEIINSQYMTSGAQVLIGKNIDVIFSDGQMIGGEVVKYTAYDIEIKTSNTTFVIPHTSVKYYRIREAMNGQRFNKK